jgi:hypothetical protein
MNDEIKDGFLAACAFLNWASPDWEYTAVEPSEAMLGEITAVVDKFVSDNKEAIEQYVLAHDSEDLRSVGHDLYFELAGDGVGFWEQDSEHAKVLSEWCQKYYSCDVYGGDDDGLIYITFNSKLTGLGWFSNQDSTQLNKVN